MQLFWCKIYNTVILIRITSHLLQPLLQPYVIQITEKNHVLLLETEMWDILIVVHIGKKYASYCSCRHIEFRRESAL